jgi:hydrogenase maturation factor
MSLLQKMQHMYISIYTYETSVSHSRDDEDSSLLGNDNRLTVIKVLTFQRCCCLDFQSNTQTVCSLGKGWVLLHRGRTGYAVSVVNQRESYHMYRGWGYMQHSIQENLTKPSMSHHHPMNMWAVLSTMPHTTKAIWEQDRPMYNRNYS